MEQSRKKVLGRIPQGDPGGFPERTLEVIPKAISIRNPEEVFERYQVRMDEGFPEGVPKEISE